MTPNGPNLGRTQARLPHPFPLSEKAASLERNLATKRWVSPSGILLLMISGIALAEVIAMIIVYFVRDRPYVQQVLLDAFIMTAIIFPLLYFLSFKPLLRHIEQQNQAERVSRLRLRLMQFANDHSLDELYQYALDEIESLVGCTTGFLFILDADEETIRTKAWSHHTLQNLDLVGAGRDRIDLDGADIVAESVRSRRAVVGIDNPVLTQPPVVPGSGTPGTWELVIPIVRHDRVTAVLGLGSTNSAPLFTPDNVKLAVSVADFAWDIFEHKLDEYALRQSEEKFRTLADWTYDWECWLDPQGKVVYTSPSCERLTGYLPEAFMANPSLLIDIVHPEDQPFYREHHAIIHDETNGPVAVEYRIVAHDGQERTLEHVCRPLWSIEGDYLGRRISNRDITQRKENERKITAQKQKEAMLTQAIQTIQTDIARDLHDSLGQNISYLRMNLAYLVDLAIVGGNGMQTQIQNMIQAADESYHLIRTTIDVLQNASLSDPLSLFSRYAAQVAERSGLHIDMGSQGNPRQLSPHQTRQLFYIFREILSNIEKHAHATQVSGQLLWEIDALTVKISDNGSGFDAYTEPSPNHYGLKFMRERAELLHSVLQVHSVPTRGTTITIVIPYDETDTSISFQG